MARTASSPRAGLITSYGLFWRTDRALRNGGDGLSMRGSLGQGQSRRLVDFSAQDGIYVMYGDFGPHYIGIAAHGSLGRRLRRHLRDRHSGKWDRFSWFGYRSVVSEPRGAETRWTVGGPLADVAPKDAMRDVEALLIGAFGLANVLHPTFRNAEEWMQVED